MGTAASSFMAMKPSSITTTPSSTSVLLKLHAPLDDDGNVPLDEPGTMCRESVQLCKTNLTFMWPLSWQRTAHIFIKAEHNAAALYIFNTITAKSFQWITTNVTEKSPSWAANSCSASHPIHCLYRTCHFINIFTTAQDTQQNSNHKQHQQETKTIYTEMELPKKNFVDNNKYNYQAKLPVLNLHYQQTNITTV